MEIERKKKGRSPKKKWDSIATEFREAHWLTKTFLTLGCTSSYHELFMSCGATQRHHVYPAPQTDQATSMVD